MDSTAVKEEPKSNEKTEDLLSSSSSSMVSFRGSMIDLDRLLEQIAASETSRAATQEKLKCLEQELDTFKDEKLEFEKNALKDGTEIESLQSSLNKLTERLRLHQTRVAAFTNVLQCQRDALTKGVEIMSKTLEKYDVVDQDNGELEELT